MKSDVQHHYKKLSKDYSKRLNLYCQHRFMDFISSYAKGKILEVGCGTGYAQERLGNAIGMDITLSLLKQNRNKVVCGNAEFIPFKNNKFDMAYSINLLEHVKNPSKVVSECKRILKKSGILILITPSKGMEKALDIAEKLSFKIPEGPHRFLDFEELMEIAELNKLKVLSSGKLILLPKKIIIVSGIFERLEKVLPWLCFFQYLIVRK